MPDFEFDRWIDAQLRNVPFPPHLLSRLAENGAARDAADADTWLDDALRDVPVPGYLESRLRRIARRRSVPLWRQMALAASLFLMVSLGAVGYLVFVTQSPGPSERNVARQPAEMNRDSTRRTTDAQIAAPRLEDVAKARTAEPAEDSQTTHSVESSKLPLPTLADVSAIGSTLKQAIDARLRSQAALGADGRLERLPELDALENSAPRGVAPPRVPGYDLLFQLKHGEHPFASPAAHKDLLSSKVPFTFRTTSYDLALRGAPSGRLPPAEEIRVEDFLAAQDYVLPPAPASGLALHAAGSASPLGDHNVKLLQLTVQAATSHTQAHPPARLIAVVDMSTRMRLGAHWETVQRGLDKLARQMTPADRLTLIGYAERPRVLLQDATGRDLQALLSSDALPQPVGAANFAAAIESAATTALAFKSPAAQRVVVITAAGGDLDEAAFEQSSQTLGEMSNAKIRWEIIRVGSTGPDSRWADLAEAGHGQFTLADSTIEVYDALVEQLIGRPLTTARGVSLKLTFNPLVVTGYRLMGHESATLTGTAGDPLEVDLHADQTATGLYELWMKPGGADWVATAELTWTEPVNGQSRHVKQPIQRGQFASSFSQAPPWLQQGIIAAKAAEALRGSYYAPSPRPLARILELATQADPRLTEQPAFHHLLTIVKSAEKLR
ncbi:MAG: VWA domain-containing protein [Planctomycetia bacterium]|nr:VWA domain-containing protein [Planctomycetia bacterium]